jgi:hypothetical protein
MRRICVCLVLTFLAGQAAKASAEPRRPRVLREPYSDDRVYPVKLLPGVPFRLDLPRGERARNIWRDSRYWMAQTTEGGSRVLIRAIDSSDLVPGKKSFIHIETRPSNLVIALEVEAVENEEVPAALQVYLEGASRMDSMEQQVQEAVDSEMVLARKRISDEERAKHEAWKKQTLNNFRDDYDWGGDFIIKNVKDNRLQTFITMEGASDKPVIELVDRSGKSEIVNYELKNGMYVVEGKVLERGQKFRLLLGNERAWIKLK